MTETINFNAQYHRRHSDSEKWNAYPENTLPMWVADSDYAVPEAVTAALLKRLAHPLFGYGRAYGKADKALSELICERMQRLHNWHISPDHIIYIPGVVPGLNMARAIAGNNNTQHNMVTALPTYPHLIHPSPILRQTMKFFGMCSIDERFTPDFDELEHTIDDNTRSLIICNPHNPVGTVYNDAELKAFARIAERRDLLICSDDIHADFVFDETKSYRPIATLSKDIAMRTITLMAASKTFNIAGLNCAYAIIVNKRIRERFATQLRGLVGGVNILGLIATDAAYRHGDAWHEQQLKHLKNNIDTCHRRVNNIAGLSMHAIEATYFAWVNTLDIQAPVKAKGFSSVYDYLLTHQLAVSDGKIFGNSNYIRLNLATSYDLVNEGLNRLETAINTI